ncbi:Protein lin-37 [Orchesella cincta]|uniref:Protein lin-37 n=1 Tax=Orchesella cincta TaxID=48709 RepID=A0A1D2MYT6_ORCCI|nr:Protein lin-37 [Orchesella cincta]
MAGIPRNRHVQEDGDVMLARNRFRNVMRQLKIQNKGYLRDGCGDKDDEEDDIDMFVNGTLPKPTHSQSHGGRKRAKVETTSSFAGSSGSTSTSYVMRLFDRSVDLSQFNELSPMYPMARAWLQNKPDRRPQKGDKEAEELELNLQQLDMNDLSNLPEEVHQLPPPEPLPVDGFGNPVSLRIPPAPPRENEPFCIHFDDESAPSPAILFQDHLDRWNDIRQRWRKPRFITSGATKLAPRYFMDFGGNGE